MLQRPRPLGSHPPFLTSGVVLTIHTSPKQRSWTEGDIRHEKASVMAWIGHKRLCPFPSFPSPSLLPSFPSLLLHGLTACPPIFPCSSRPQRYSSEYSQWTSPCLSRSHLHVSVGGWEPGLNTQIKQYLTVLIVKGTMGHGIACETSRVGEAPLRQGHCELRTEKEPSVSVKNIPVEGTAHAKARWWEEA